MPRNYGDADYGYDDPYEDPYQPAQSPSPYAPMAPPAEGFGGTWAPGPWAPGATPDNVGPGQGFLQPEGPVPPGYQWDSFYNKWVPVSAPNPDPPGGGGGGYGGSDGPEYAFGPAPEFAPPGFTPPPAFEAPSADDVLSDPGYRFRLGQGKQALEQSAAGRGVLRTGGTLKDLISYGQNFASQEYGNVYNRARNTYGTNYGVSRDVFDRTYQGARDAFTPRFDTWKVQTSAMLDAANRKFDREWDQYVFGADDDYRYAELGMR